MTTEEKFLYDGKIVTRDELAAIVEPEAAQEPEGTWQGGEFDFSEWLIDALMTGLVKRVESDL